MAAAGGVRTVAPGGGAYGCSWVGGACGCSCGGGRAWRRWGACRCHPWAVPTACSGARTVAASSSWLLTGYGRGRRKSGGGPAWQRCRLSLPRRCGAGLSRRWVWGRVDRLGGGGACRCSVGVAWDGRDAAHGRKGGPTG